MLPAQQPETDDFALVTPGQCGLDLVQTAWHRTSFAFIPNTWYDVNRK